MVDDGPADSAGPSSAPPKLPDGWLAQWEGMSQKWYFVQRTTGKSQWELPTSPVGFSPSTTPTSTGSGPSKAPSSRPSTNSPQRGGSLREEAIGTTEDAGRGIVSDLLNSHGHFKDGGLAQMAIGMLGKLSNSSNQNAQPSQQSHPHGFHQVSPQHSPLGYSSNQQAGVYTGFAPQKQSPYTYNAQPEVQQPHAANQHLFMNPHGQLSAQFGQTSGPIQNSESSTQISATTPIPSNSRPPPVGPDQPPWQIGQQSAGPIGARPHSSQIGMGPFQAADSGPASQAPYTQGPVTSSSEQQIAAASQPLVPAQGAQQHSQMESNAPAIAELSGSFPSGYQSYSPQQPIGQKPYANTKQHGANSSSPQGLDAPASLPAQNSFVSTPHYSSHGSYQLNGDPIYGPHSQHNPQPSSHHQLGRPSGTYGSTPAQRNSAWENQPYAFQSGSFPPRFSTSTDPHHSTIPQGGYDSCHNYPHLQSAHVAGSRVHQDPPLHYQPYHPLPNQSPDNLDHWGQLSSLPARTAPSDPQFVSGPWTSGGSSYGPMQPSQYGGYADSRRR